MEELKALYETRKDRTFFRAQGLELLTELLAQRSAVPMQVDLLVSFMRALRKVRGRSAEKQGCCGEAWQRTDIAFVRHN